MTNIKWEKIIQFYVYQKMREIFYELFYEESLRISNLNVPYAK